jgi:hypothetical protein
MSATTGTNSITHTNALGARGRNKPYNPYKCCKREKHDQRENAINAIAVVAFFVCLAFPPSSAFAASSVNVPLDSWVYGALDRLEGYGLIDSALSGTKPYSRLEVARLLAEAMKKWDEAEARNKPSGFGEADLIPSLMERFKRDFKRELIEIGVLEGSKSPSFLKPVDEVILKYVFQTDNPVVRPQIPNVNPPTQVIYPIYNNDGIVYQKGNNFSSEIEGEGGLWNHFSLYYRPIFKAFEDQNPQVDLEKGYLKLEGLNLELEAGRDSLWWGPGYNSGLLMTNNARPFDLVKLSSPQPFSLPFIGLFKFNVFLTQLDYGGPTQESPSQIGKPTLYGLHLDFKPHPMFEMGFSQITIFGGEGRKALSLVDYAKILYSRTNNDSKLASNQMLDVDFSFLWPDFHRILPVFRSFKLYGEWMVDDPTQWAYLIGLCMNDLLLAGRADLRLEYVNSAYHVIPVLAYTHASYPPIFHDRLFGYQGGGNVEDIFARLNIYLSPKAQLGFDFEVETEGKKLAVTTESYRWGADLDYLFRNQISIKGRYILESFKDPSSIAGGDAIHHLFLLEFRKRF